MTLAFVIPPTAPHPANAAGLVKARVDAGVLAQFAKDPAGTSTFVVLLKGEAGTAPAAPGTNRIERVRRVLTEEKAYADAAQADIRRLLSGHSVAYTPYWIANAVKVTADKSVMLDLASRSDVDTIVPDRKYPLIQPVTASAAQATGTGVEWNIDRIGAPKVWSAYGDRGEGVVVGTIDTGAQFDHPAIARQYRGARPDGSAPSNEYNWFDPMQVCSGPSPCDDVGHGTHVLGTILGDDGQGNQIGVAPRAKWIAAKGCATYGCPLSALLAAGQWMLAPTDSQGANPRPDLAPDVINNSWAGGQGDSFYQRMVDAWVAAGIVPVFAAGNSGSACGTARSPGDYSDSLAVGAFDQQDAIASFSSRGPGGFGVMVKPDLSAPGVDVRSSVAGDGYGLLSGTSMAAPHVTGTVALAISAAPALRGDVSAVKDLLNSTTVPTPDDSCGGTSADNNVWGHGRLDAFMAVTKAPREPVGGVCGTVLAGNQPLVGAHIEVHDVITRTATTDAEGRYTVGALPTGESTVTVSAFGYVSQTAPVATEPQATTVLNFDLTAGPRFTLSGKATSAADGAPLPGVTVTLADTPAAPVVTDATGSYRITNIPRGTYNLVFDGVNCTEPAHRSLTVASDTALDVAMSVKSDGLGHSCRTAPAQWIDASTLLPLSGDESTLTVTLPFPVEFSGATYTSVNVVTDGYLSFTSTQPLFVNQPIPTGGDPGASIFAFWDDLKVDSSGSVRTAVVGTAPNRRFVIEWSNLVFFDTPDLHVSFEAILAEDGSVTLQYQGTDSQPRTAGASASIGIQDGSGSSGIQYSSNVPALSDGVAIEFTRS